MRLYVKTVGGETAEVEVDPDLPLAVARAQIASALAVDEGEVALCHSGRLLPAEGDGQPLNVCGLRDGNTIVAVPRRGTPKANSQEARTPAACLAAVPETKTDADLARQMQADEDESVARKLQEELDHTMARDEQANQAAQAGGQMPPPRLLFVSSEFVSVGRTVPLLVDTGAQASVLASGVVEKLGLMGAIDRRYAGVVGGVGTARVLGKLSGIEVRFGELSLTVDFQVLDGSQMPTPNLAILGLDQLAQHHMVVDLDRNVLLVGGSEGYVVRILDAHEIPSEFNVDPAQQCNVQ